MKGKKEIKEEEKGCKKKIGKNRRKWLIKRRWKYKKELSKEERIRKMTKKQREQ